MFYTTVVFFETECWNYVFSMSVQPNESLNIFDGLWLNKLESQQIRRPYGLITLV